MARLAAVVGLLLVAGAAGAQLGYPELPHATLVRLEGTSGPPQPGHSAAADLTLEHGDLTDRLQVEEARVLAGDLSGPDVLAAAAARRPSFRLRGPRELLSRLDAARPGDRVEISGYLRLGSPDLSVTSVDVRPAPAHD